MRNLAGSQNQQARLLEFRIKRRNILGELFAFGDKGGRFGHRIGRGRGSKLLQPRFSLCRTRLDVGNRFIQIFANLNRNGAKLD